MFECLTKDYKLQYTTTVPDLAPATYNDLTECVKLNCLFLSDFKAKCIRKVEPNGDQTKVRSDLFRSTFYCALCTLCHIGFTLHCIFHSTILIVILI